MTFLDGKARLRIFATEYQGGFNRKPQAQGTPSNDSGTVAPVAPEQNPFAKQSGPRQHNSGHQGASSQGLNQARPSQQGTNQQGVTQQSANNGNRRSMFVARNGPRVYFKCKADHLIYACPEFTILNDFKTREVFINKLGLCMNCFNPNHVTNDCTTEGCRGCWARISRLSSIV